jgi:hypothetical protein
MAKDNISNKMTALIKQLEADLKLVRPGNADIAAREIATQAQAAAKEANNALKGEAD